MNDHVICPHCGDTIRDLWDYGWGAAEEIEANCGSCGGDIVLHREISAHYSVERKERHR